MGTDSLAIGGTSKPARIALLEVALLAALATILTGFAWRAFPTFDDGTNWLLIQHGGGQAIADASPDRPQVAWIYQILLDHGMLWQASVIVHWTSWFLTGLETLWLWKLLFPNQRRFAIGAACLAISPVLCQTGYVLFNETLAPLFGPAITWLVILPLLSPRAAQWSAGKSLLMHALMAVVVAATVQLSEYPISSVIAGAVLLTLRGAWPPGKRQPWITIGLLVGAAAVSYFAYHHFHDAAARRMVRPEMQDLGHRARTMPLRLLAGTWYMGLGEFLQRLGAATVSISREVNLGFLAGIMGAGVVGWIGWWTSRAQAADVDENSSVGPLRMFLTLLASVACGLAPIIFMGRTLGTRDSSRFACPLLPVGACLTVYCLTYLIRPKLWLIVPASCGFLAVYLIVSDGLLEMHERNDLVALGDRLEPSIPSNGLTVAVIHRRWRHPSWVLSQGTELTARLTQHWTAAKRDHFWAIPDADLADMGIRFLTDPFGPQPRLDRPLYNSFRPLANPSFLDPPRPETVDRVLWVTEEEDGQITVQPVAASTPQSP